MAKTDQSNPSPRKETPQQATKRAIDELSATWRKAHAERTAKLEADLLAERTNARADEVLLVRLAAHDGALSERLADAELQLSERLSALVDNAAVALSLARALQRTIACREACARRLRDLLQAAAVVRAQRGLAEKTRLKAVA